MYVMQYPQIVSISFPIQTKKKTKHSFIQVIGL